MTNDPASLVKPAQSDPVEGGRAIDARSKSPWGTGSARNEVDISSSRINDRILKLVLSLSAAVTGCVLAFHYPIAQPLPIIGFVLFAALAFFKPWYWPVLIPAILPVTGFAPWTGWLTFEELDLLVLATAAGGYANHCAFAPQGSARRQSSVLIALASVMAVSLFVSMFRGFLDAWGFSFGWFQGYDGPMNSVRIAKSFFLALLLVPLMNRLQREDEGQLAHNLGLGFALGLGFVSLATIWERLAFTDLLNFSSDYRSTALFWEMHVGGAALDGWLVLTIPFAAWALRTARTTARLILACILTGIAAYACLTTFSRGVYLALFIALPLLAWLVHRKEKSASNSTDTTRWGPLQWFISFALIAALAYLVFPGSGYRGLLALLGILAISVSIPASVRSVPPARIIAAGATGCLLGWGLAVLANFIPKGPYFLYALLFAATASTLHVPVLKTEKTIFPYSAAGLCGLAMAAVNVSAHWGEEGSALSMVYALIVIAVLLIWSGLSRKPLWPSDLRWQGSLLTVSVVTCGLVAIFSGGAYMGDRFSTSGKDADNRLSHWRDAVSMLHSPLDMAFGKGLGRFPANYFFSIPNAAFPGTYKVAHENDNGYLSITGANHPISFGDLFRVSQRIRFSAQGPFELEFRARAKTDTTIHAEICEKHLLYVASCVIRNLAVKETKGEWQSIKIRLEGPLLNNGVWYAPRFKMFSIGIENQAGSADIDDLILTEPGSDNLLANPHFSDEMRHWFFSSDRDHMPWHAKNLQINTLFDQGLSGLVTSTLLLLVALWRLNIGRGAQLELSPYMTASIVGFIVVGLFDSLTDVPRVAFIYYLILVYSIAQNTNVIVRKKHNRRSETSPSA